MLKTVVPAPALWYNPGKAPAGQKGGGNMRTVKTGSPEETEQLGFQLGCRAEAGAVIAFTGDLGAGKTAFTRGLARGLGIRDRITSPTFTIVNEYEGGRLPLFHFDLYRLRSSEELFDIGWEEYLDRGGVCAVEWSENAPAVLEDCTLRVDIRRGDGENSRVITLEGKGEAQP